MLCTGTHDNHVISNHCIYCFDWNAKVSTCNVDSSGSSFLIIWSYNKKLACSNALFTEWNKNKINNNKCKK